MVVGSGGLGGGLVDGKKKREEWAWERLGYEIQRFIRPIILGGMCDIVFQEHLLSNYALSDLIIFSSTAERRERERVEKNK